MSTRSLVPIDATAALERLRREERELSKRLAELVAALRRFEGEDEPEFARWRRLEFGPMLQAIEETFEALRVRQIVARRVVEGVEGGLHAREALFFALGGAAPADTGIDSDRSSESRRESGWDAEEIEARRRAKREAKRAARREARRESVHADHASEGTRRKDLYRRLARALHPDARVAVAHSELGEERARALWLEAQAAYESHDDGRLLAIAVGIADFNPTGGEASARTGDSARSGGPAGDSGPAPSLGERASRLRGLRQACAQLDRRIERARAHPAWGFGALRGGERRRHRQRVVREIDAELARAQEALAAVEAFLDGIGPPRPPKSRPRRR